MIEPTNLEISKSIDKSIIGALEEEIERFSFGDNSRDLARIIYDVVGMGSVCDVLEICSDYIGEL